LRLERDRRTLVDLDQVELEFGGLVTAAKVRLEVVGRRVRAEHPDVAPEVVSTVSRLIREALEELAGRDEAKELADGR
jgi:hypothetical protein